MDRKIALIALALAGGLAFGAPAAAPPMAPAGIRPAAGRFLVASRELADPNFTSTVVLLLAAGGDGAMGVVINRPMRAKLSTIVPDVEALKTRPDRVHFGGPVMGSALLVLVRAAAELPETERVLGDVRVMTSREAVRRALEAAIPPSRLRAFAGHAGWAPGQLEAEIARGDWYVVAGSAELVFAERAEDVWPRLIERSEGLWARGPGPAAQVQARSAIISGEYSIF